VDDDARAYIAVTRLYAAYADAVTRRAWTELDALFAPDAPIHIDRVNAEPIELTGPVDFARFVAASIERFEFFEFVILNTVVRVLGEGAARGRLYMVELRQDRESGEWSHAFGVYHDALAAVDGTWRFAERHYQSLARRTGGQRAEVFTFPAAHGTL
jgi:hypothetical protein